MKAKLLPPEEKPKFKPLQLVITIDTQKELDAWSNITNHADCCRLLRTAGIGDPTLIYNVLPRASNNWQDFRQSIEHLFV